MLPDWKAYLILKEWELPSNRVEVIVKGMRRAYLVRDINSKRWIAEYQSATGDYILKSFGGEE